MEDKLHGMLALNYSSYLQPFTVGARCKLCMLAEYLRNGQRLNKGLPRCFGGGYASREAFLCRPNVTL